MTDWAVLFDIDGKQRKSKPHLNDKFCRFCRVIVFL